MTIETLPITAPALIDSFLNLLQHSDTKVRAAALQQLIAGGMPLSDHEKLTIFTRDDWRTVYPDLDIAVAYFYAPKVERDDDAIAANTYTVRQWTTAPRIQTRTWPAWFWVLCGAAGLIVGGIFVAGVIALVTR